VDVGFVDPNWPDWEVPVSPLINEIRRERRIEITMEGEDRWFDLIRWKAGRLLEGRKTQLGAYNPEKGAYHEIWPGFVREWDDKLYFRPIPTQDLTLNPNLHQNPGWE
ncbi:MAG TPA: RagB/SusD family nutrient uptake outer membrane protein, partial [Cyclobacteriaceae bacterium]|nr:RagB/SusD family nutrient uptake outer membrane protein [Cyclobacteriaceae bacterium]